MNRNIIPILMKKNVPWYLRGGIPKANCLAAYQPKNASSYAASKMNIANPGTNDLSDGAAFPTWASATGWTFNGALSQLLVINSAIISAAPLSMVCRFYADNATGTLILLSIGDTDVDSFFRIDLRGAVAGDPIYAMTNQGGVGGHAATTSGFTALTWYTTAAIYSSATSRAVYINGGSKGTDATNVTPANLDNTTIGVCKANNTLAGYMFGKIAACAFYNIALSDAQVLALHNAMVAI
jgi:hypothetical protein